MRNAGVNTCATSVIIVATVVIEFSSCQVKYFVKLAYDFAGQMTFNWAKKPLKAKTQF